MTGELLIFAGAPEQGRLEWSEKELTHIFKPAFTHFICHPRHHGGRITGGYPQKDDCLGRAKDVNDEVYHHESHTAVWRVLRQERVHLSTGFSQQHNYALTCQISSSDDFYRIPATTPFTASADYSTVYDEDDGDVSQEVGDFFNHSLAYQDDERNPSVESQSQLEHNNTTLLTEGGTSFITDTSLDDTTFLSNNNDNTTTTTSHNIVNAAFQAGSVPPAGSLRLCNLKDIPSARHLTSIEPQTVTVNLVVGIISIAAPRSIKTRWGNTRTLVEILVGDETKSGFAITFWLQESSPPQQQRQQQQQREGGLAKGQHGTASVLAGLRSQDVVLVQNAALNVFQKKVYGHSLRGTLTKVELLFRHKVDRDDVGGVYSAKQLGSAASKTASITPDVQLEKTRVVREWVLRFVGAGSDTRGLRKGALGKRVRTRPWDERPPLDTQE